MTGKGHEQDHSPVFDTVVHPQYPDLYEASIAELQEGLQEGLFTSVDLVKAYLARIEEVYLQGPKLHAVIETNPSALAQAVELDRERKKRGPPWNSDLAQGQYSHSAQRRYYTRVAIYARTSLMEAPSTGSFALLGSIVPRDAHVAAKLRAAGAIFLGKANLSEWARFRDNVPQGFSGRGGQASSPYVHLGDPSGSSSGSAIGVAIGLAAAALGTETDGSIVSPSSANNLVGIKPTVGLTSRDGVIPISEHQDTVRPMARSVADAATILTIIGGRDLRDNFILAQPAHVPDYTQALNAGALRGARLGVPRRAVALLDDIRVAAFNASLKTLRAHGATIVDPTDFPDSEELLASDNETIVLNTDIKVGVEKRGTRGIDGALSAFDLDALLLPTDIAFTPPAIAGFPIVTVPLGFLPTNTPLAPAKPTRESGPNMPFGLAFLGTAFSEFELISLAFAYEQATHTRLKVRAFPAAIPKTQLAELVGK
ncbi:amidase signature domain-containing protein [Trametes gibbosa]|nr:amidase signature domain-containing protein [Trametes gibbosa]